MPSPAATDPVQEWNEPAGIVPRGTLILLTGRGEPPSTYGRFGRRLAADAYRVRAVSTRLHDLDASRATAASLVDDPDLPHPKVLVGGDAGAAFATLLAGSLDIDGLIVCGLAVPGVNGRLASSWDDELDLRTACPAHREVMTRDVSFDRGQLAEDLPRALAPGTPPRIPTLVIHGDADAVAPPRSVLALFSGVPEARSVVIAGGRHDILNDVGHRSVAATIVLFLESLRLGPDLPAIVRESWSA